MESGTVIGRMGIVHVGRKVLIEPDMIFELEQMELEIAAAQIFNLEAEIIDRDQLHSEH